MTGLDRSSLRRFLARPRFINEIAENHGISKRAAIFHLREAIETGHVLISEKPILKSVRDSEGRLRKLKGFVYIHRKSSMLDAKSLTVKIGDRCWHTGFLRFHDMSKIMAVGSRPSTPTIFEAAGTQNNAESLKDACHPMSKFVAASARIAPARSARLGRLVSSKAQSNREVKSFLNVEKINLFRLLLKKPSPFLELHFRFGVSKRTIARFVKRGLLAEIWGSEGVGVRFKLTSQGKAYLRRLQEAARYEPQVKENDLIRLKHRIAV